MTGWQAFVFIAGCFGGFIAWGFWCQHVIDRNEARRKQQAKHDEDVRLAQQYRDAYLARVDEAVQVARDFDTWEREVSQ